MGPLKQLLFSTFEVWCSGSICCGAVCTKCHILLTYCFLICLEKVYERLIQCFWFLRTQMTRCSPETWPTTWCLMWEWWWTTWRSWSSASCRASSSPRPPARLFSTAKDGGTVHPHQHATTHRTSGAYSEPSPAQREPFSPQHAGITRETVCDELLRPRLS